MIPLYLATIPLYSRIDAHLSSLPLERNANAVSLSSSLASKSKLVFSNITAVLGLSISLSVKLVTLVIALEYDAFCNFSSQRESKRTAYIKDSYCCCKFKSLIALLGFAVFLIASHASALFTNFLSS